MHGGRGSGKALALDTPIPTPNGWTTIKDIGIGDVVFSEDGKPTKVIAVSNVQLNQNCYRVTFNDGSEIVASEDHRWMVTNRRARKSCGRRVYKDGLMSIHNPSVKTTREIAETLTDMGGVNYSIDVAGALQLPERELFLNPYTLGLWLGDGNSHNGTVWIFEEELLSYIEAKYVAPNQYRIEELSGASRDDSNGRFKPGALRQLNLYRNKHIPPEYLRASYNQRLALLQGLMDSDGYVDKLGHCEFTNVNGQLANDVHELILSLGMKATLFEDRATLYGKDCGIKYRIYFNPEIEVFRLKRKLTRQHIPNKRAQRRFIIDVVPTDSVPVKCIMVDSPSHLYLAGRTMIPTHNTFSGATKALLYMINYPGALGCITAPTFTILNDSTLTVFINLCNKWGLTRGVDWDYVVNRHEFTLSNGSRALFRSTDESQRLRGMSLAFFWMDEAAIGPEIAATNLQLSLRQGKGQAPDGGNIYPLMGWITTTPAGGRDHWLYHKFFDADQEGNWEYLTFHARTQDNPYGGKELYDALVNSMGGPTSPVVRQELLGEFVSLEGLVYPTFDRAIHVVSEDLWPVREPRYIICGVDFGWTAESAFLVEGYHPTERPNIGYRFIIDEYYQKHLTQDDICNVADDLRKRYNIGFFVCDSEDPRLIRAMKHKGIPAYGIKKHNTVLYGKAACTRAINFTIDDKPAFFVSPKAKNWIFEIENYSDVPPREMINPSERPREYRNHLMDSWRYSEIEIVRWYEQSISRVLKRF